MTTHRYGKKRTVLDAVVLVLLIGDHQYEVQEVHFHLHDDVQLPQCSQELVGEVRDHRRGAPTSPRPTNASTAPKMRRRPLDLTFSPAIPIGTISTCLTMYSFLRAIWNLLDVKSIELVRRERRLLRDDGNAFSPPPLTPSPPGR